MFVAKYVFIDEHIALSIFPHQKCIWITNLKKNKEYSFWTYSFKGWLMSAQEMTGIKKVACGQTNPDGSENHSWFKDFRSPMMQRQTQFASVNTLYCTKIYFEIQ